MKAQLEPQNIDSIAQRVVELLKPHLLGRVETTIIPIPSKSKGEYMTVPQLAEYLQISKSTIFSWIYQRKIPYSKIGRRVTNEAIIIWTGILSFHHPGFRLPPE